MQYNYGPLVSMVTSTDIKMLRKHYKTGAPSPYKRILLIAIIYVLVSTLSMVVSAVLVKSWWYLAQIILVAATLLFGTIILYSFIQKRIWARYVRLSRFALANGMSFIPATLNPAYNGMIFGFGHSRCAYDQIKNDGSRLFEVGNYKYVVGSGRSRRTIDYGYIMIKLDRNLPHMVLDSQANNFKLMGLGASNLPLVFKKDQRLSLEGDFDKHFTLYAPTQYERDALYVFTPDLMALFIDETDTFDAEIVDNRLFIYANKPFNLLNQKILGRIFSIIETVGEKAISQTDHYADERVGDRVSDVVAEPGRRLKSRTSHIIIIIVIIYVIYQMATPLVNLFTRLSGV